MLRMITPISIAIKAIMMVPAIDLTRTWTDQELYEHFNLTEEEINYIEEQVR